MKFKVGDRVYRTWNPYVPGVVARIDNGIYVRWANSNDFTGAYWENNLELLMEPNDIMKELCSK